MDALECAASAPPVTGSGGMLSVQAHIYRPAVERALVGDGADAASARHLELARQALLHERQDLAAVELHRSVARVLRAKETKGCLIRSVEKRDVRRVEWSRKRALHTESNPTEHLQDKTSARQVPRPSVLLPRLAPASLPPSRLSFLFPSYRQTATHLGDLSAAHRILDHCCDHWQSSGSRADRAPENLPLLLLFLKRCRTHPRVTIPPIMLIVGCLLVCRLQHNAVDHPIPVQPASPVTFELRVRSDPQHSARRKISRKLSRGLKGNRTLLPRNAFQETVHALRVKTSRATTVPGSGFRQIWKWLAKF
eukprot:3635842-Rhodomonas_salina.5